MTPREQAIAWAIEVANDPGSVFLDTETTGLGDKAEICDIAIVHVTGAVILDTLVKPSWGIPAEATAVHGITEADVAYANAWSGVGLLVRGNLYGRRIVVYNADYDSKIVNQVCEMAGMPPMAVGWQCAMKAFSDYDGTVNTFARRRGATTPRWGPKWWKLGEAAAKFGIENPGAHRALADAETCRRLVLAMAGRPIPKTAIEPVQSSMFGGDPDAHRRRLAESLTER